MPVMPAQRVFPDMDIDLERAVRRVAAALISPDGRKATRPRASDAEVFDVLDRVVDIMTDLSSAPESVALAFALDLLWPRTEIDGMKLIKTVESTLRPDVKPGERKAAYLAARAVLSAWDVNDGPASRPGGPEDPRVPAEVMLRAFGMKLERIAEFTESRVPPREGAERVRQRIYRYLKREEPIHHGAVTPAALTFIARLGDGAEPVEIRPMTAIPRAAKPRSRTKRRDDGRKHGKQESE
jgi:hypothetical protein